MRTLPDTAVEVHERAPEWAAEGLRAARIQLWADLVRKVESVEEQVAERTARLTEKIERQRLEIARLRRNAREHALTRLGR